MSDSFSAWIDRVHGNSTCSLPPPPPDHGWQTTEASKVWGGPRVLTHDGSVTRMRASRLGCEGN